MASFRARVRVRRRGRAPRGCHLPERAAMTLHRGPALVDRRFPPRRAVGPGGGDAAGRVI